MEISFSLDIVPCPKGRPRLGRFGAFTPARTREYENALKWQFKKNSPPSLFVKPLKLYVEFVLSAPKKPKFKLWPAVKPDIDNLLKAILDSGNGTLWKDDGLVCEIRAIKTYGVAPGIIVKVEEL